MFHSRLSPEIAQGLKALRKRIKASDIPSSKIDETLNIATWNVREFGRRRRRAASLHYIAEIIGQFDVVALVELRDRLGELKTVLEYLGPYWRCVYSSFLTDQGSIRRASPTSPACSTSTTGIIARSSRAPG